MKPPTGVDYVAMETELKRRLAAGPETVKELRSILISVDGTTELAFYQGSKATDHQHVWSVTKSVLSILVGIAVDEGKLRLDQPLAELLPEHASVMTDDQKATTLRQLLTMTGGMAGDGGGLNPEADDPIGLLLTYSSTGPRDVFAYSNSGAHLVAAVLHEAVDRSILDYAREKLFDPLGIDSQPAWEGVNPNLKDGFDDAGFAWQTDSKGTHIGAYGLKLTPPDLVKLGELYLDEGMWHGRRIVSADWVRASTAPQLTEEQAASGGQYGYLWWVEHDPEMPVYTARRRVVPARARDPVAPRGRSQHRRRQCWVRRKPGLRRPRPARGGGGVRTADLLTLILVGWSPPWPPRPAGREGRPRPYRRLQRSGNPRARLRRGRAGARRLCRDSRSGCRTGQPTGHRRGDPRGRRAGALHQSPGRLTGLAVPRPAPARRNEDYLTERDVAFTSLRHGFYASTFEVYLPDAGELRLPGRPVSWTAHADLAEVDAIALTPGPLDGVTPPLTAPAAGPR